MWTKDAICRFCKEDEEIPVHVLWHCEDLARIRPLVLDIQNPIAHSYIKELLLIILSLIKRAELEGAF